MMKRPRRLGRGEREEGGREVKLDNGIDRGQGGDVRG